MRFAPPYRKMTQNFPCFWQLGGLHLPHCEQLTEEGEPSIEREPRLLSEPFDRKEPRNASEPCSWIVTTSESEPLRVREPQSWSEPAVPERTKKPERKYIMKIHQNEPDDSEIGIVKLNKDLKKLAASMNVDEARHLVDSYYQMQENRMRFGGQIRAMKDEPHAVLEWLEGNASRLEKQIASALTCFAESQHMGVMAMSVVGVGPIMAAGLIAHIKPDVPTVGAIWRFAGLDPSSKWEKGEKRPWNAALKKLCFLIGESFVKVHNNPKSLYGRIYRERKEYETAKNEKGDYAEQAKTILERNPRHAQAAIYKTGKLPPGQLHMRAKRYAVKLFLSHWHEEAYRHSTGKEPPKPYVLEHGGHAHYIAPEWEPIKQKAA